MAKVFIAVGHGGSDCGAVANGLREADMNLVAALKCKEVLESAGVLVGISRMSDENDKLADEIAECNAFAPDVAIEIHFNSFNGKSGDGFEVFVQSQNKDSRHLGECIEREVLSIGQNSRGVKEKRREDGADWYGWLRCVNCPAVLLEGAFIDTADHVIVDTIAEQQAFGEAYARGVLRHLKIPMSAKDKEIEVLRNAINEYEIERNQIINLLNKLEQILY